MNFLKNIFKPKNETANDSGNNGWNSLQNAEAERKEAEKRQMHEDKATMALLYDNPNALFQNEAAEPTESERIELYRKIYNNEIGVRQMRDLLLNIAPPAYTRNGSPEKVFDNLSDSYSANIFRFVNGFDNNAQNPTRLDASIVERTISLYPTPYEFEPVADEMIRQIDEQGSSDNYNQYVKSMIDFKKNIYGKRQEYYYTLEDITSQARQQKHTDDTNRRIEVQQNSPLDYQPPQSDRGYYSPEAQAAFYSNDSEE